MQPNKTVKIRIDIIVKKTLHTPFSYKRNLQNKIKYKDKKKLPCIFSIEGKQTKIKKTIRRLTKDKKESTLQK